MNDEPATPADFINEATESEGASLDRSNSNPGDLPEGLAYRPKPDPVMVYLEEKNQVLDPRTGERFWLKIPHGDGMGRYSLANAQSEIIVSGGYYAHRYHEAPLPRLVVYEIVSTKRWEPGAPDYTPEELDVSRLATFIRARHDAKTKSLIDVIVVDSRGGRGTKR